MKTYLLTSLLALTAVAAPLAEPQSETGASGPCKNVTLIFARGTTETGNMGFTVGPSLAIQMRAVFGATNVAVQGVD